MPLGVLKASSMTIVPLAVALRDVLDRGRPTLPMIAVAKPACARRRDQRSLIQIVAAEMLVHVAQHRVVLEDATGAMPVARRGSRE